jgi:Carboxypeptidase regulatory-like domain
MRLGIAALLMLLAATMPAFSSHARSDAENPPQTGSVHGNLIDQNEGGSSGLAGITVLLTTIPADGNTLTADSDDTGRYEFTNLKAGNYTLSISQPGFNPVTNTVSVLPGKAVIQDIKLELETVSEKVEVHEENLAISTESSATPTETVTEQEIVALPTAQEKVKEVLPITPGVIRTLDGKLNFKGSDENQSLLLVNSARTADPATGSFSISVPSDAVQSFAVFKTPYNAGLGSFSGGLTTIETKPPQDRWNFRVKNPVPFVLGKNGQISGLGEATPGVDFGGPLFGRKLFFSEVFQYDMKKRTVRGLPYPEDISKRQGFDSFTTLESILSGSHILIVTVNAFPSRTQNLDINALVPQGASNDLDQNGIAVAAVDKYQFESGAILSTVAQYTRFDSNAHGQGLADMLITPEGVQGNFFNRWSRRGKEVQLFPAYQFAEARWHGRHEIHAGLDAGYRSFFGTNVSQPVQLLRADGSLAEQISFQGRPSQSPSDSSVAEFVQDHWILNTHWSVDLGARLSSETKGWSAALAPRAGIAYSPDGKTVFRAGTGLFYNVLPLLAADFALNPTRLVSQFDLTGQTIGTPVTLTNAYVGGINPISGAILPGEPDTAPRNFTWNVEGDRQLLKKLVLRVGYIDSHTTYLFTIDPFVAPQGGNSFLGLTNTGSSHYREWETTARYTFRDHNQVNASYIWSRLRGDLNNLSSVLIPFEQPVIRPNVYGILPQDIPNRVVTWGIFSIPWKMTFSPIADVHTGYPYSNVDVQQDYVGTPNGQRFATFFSLDLKLYREFRVPFTGINDHKAHHFRLGVYTLNATNHGNFNAVYNNVTAPNFGQFAGFLDRRDGAIIEFVD